MERGRAVQWEKEGKREREEKEREREEKEREREENDHSSYRSFSLPP
jgi:hypothetical protein